MSTTWKTMELTLLMHGQAGSLDAIIQSTESIKCEHLSSTWQLLNPNALFSTSSVPPPCFQTPCISCKHSHYLHYKMCPTILPVSKHVLITNGACYHVSCPPVDY